MIKRIFKKVFCADAPAHLILHVTNRCNLKCDSCFVDFDRHGKDKELELAQIKQLARGLKGLVWLDISGGEPFLRDDLPDICSQFDTGAISIPTNGYDSRRIYDMTRRVKNGTPAQVSVAVSLDGFEGTNDRIRGSGCFRKAVQTLRLLKEVEGVRVKVNTVLCEKNYNETIDFMKHIKGLDVDFHSIIFLRGTPRDPAYKQPSYEKLQDIKKDIFNIWDTYDYGMRGAQAKVLKNYQRLMYEASLMVIKDRKQAPRCVAGKRHLVIYANGDAAFCEMLKPFGNLREKDIRALLASGKAKAQRQEIAAGKCFCHHNCNLLDNFFLNPLQYPRLLGGACKR